MVSGPRIGTVVPMGTTFTARRARVLAAALAVLLTSALGVAFAGSAAAVVPDTGGDTADDVYVTPSSTVVSTVPTSAPSTVPTPDDEVDSSAAAIANDDSTPQVAAATQVAGATQERGLAFTGQDAGLTALLGAGAIIVGALILLARRRTATTG